MGILVLGGMVVVGSIVFWVLLQHSIILNPSLYGLTSWWLSCVIGTGLVGYILVSIFFGAVSWVVELIEDYYVYIIGAVVVIYGIKAMGKKDGLNDDKKIEQ